MIIECTNKLAANMKIDVRPYDASNPDPLYEWHANLFRFDRRKGVLLMNNKTRYCIVLYGVKMEHFRKFDKVLYDAIKETFLAEGFSANSVNRYIENCGDVHFTKTHDPKILGQMTDFYAGISWEIEKHIPSEHINLVALNTWVGKRIMNKSMNYAYPIEALREAMAAIESE